MVLLQQIGVQGYIVSSPHATNAPHEILLFSSGTFSMGGMAWVVYDVKIIGVCMHGYVLH